MKHIEKSTGRRHQSSSGRILQSSTSGTQFFVFWSSLDSFLRHHRALRRRRIVTVQAPLNQDARNYHQLARCSSPNAQIGLYRMTDVIYGLASSSYHAVRALRKAAGHAGAQKAQLANKELFYWEDIINGGVSQK